MNFDDPLEPSLVEPGVKYFLHQSLKQCHIVREKFENTIFNIGLLFGFLLILGLILIYKYKGKLTPNEIQHQWILNSKGKSAPDETQHQRP